MTSILRAWPGSSALVQSRPFTIPDPGQQEWNRESISMELAGEVARQWRRQQDQRSSCALTWDMGAVGNRPVGWEAAQGWAAGGLGAIVQRFLSEGVLSQQASLQG